MTPKTATDENRQHVMKLLAAAIQNVADKEYDIAADRIERLLPVIRGWGEANWADVQRRIVKEE